MKRSRLPILIVGMTLYSMVLIMGCAKNTGIKLGPMPSEAEMPDPTARQTATDMRTWVENLKSEDAKTLIDTGKLTFTWQELQTAYPQQATQIDNYSEAKRLSLVEAITKQNHPVSDRLTVHHAPDTVEIEKNGEGRYQIAIKSQTGIGASYLQISQ